MNEDSKLRSNIQKLYSEILIENIKLLLDITKDEANPLKNRPLIYATYLINLLIWGIGFGNLFGVIIYILFIK